MYLKLYTQNLRDGFQEIEDKELISLSRAIEIIRDFVKDTKFTKLDTLIGFSTGKWFFEITRQDCGALWVRWYVNREEQDETILDDDINRVLGFFDDFKEKLSKDREVLTDESMDKTNCQKITKKKETFSSGSKELLRNIYKAYDFIYKRLGYILFVTILVWIIFHFFLPDSEILVVIPFILISCVMGILIGLEAIIKKQIFVRGWGNMRSGCAVAFGIFMIMNMLCVLIMLIVIIYGLFSSSDLSNNIIPDTQELTIEDKIIFSGKVSKGQKFERKIDENIVFILNPDDLGWILDIVDAQTQKNSYSVVTLPLRGMRPTQIFGFHLRNNDNSGPNDTSVNAPGLVREFEFVTNEEDFEKVSDAIEMLNWSYMFEEAEVEEAGKIFWGVGKSKGIFKITDMEFDNLKPGEQTGFEWIEFEVEIII